MKGLEIESKIYSIFLHPKKVSALIFPPENQKVLAIFWASWCGPCKIEMNRLKQSVLNGKIANDKIYAINPFEGFSEIEKFLSKNDYPFIFMNSPDLSRRLNIQVTPSTLFIENNRVSSMESGMSLIGIWRAELFLNN